MVRRRLCVTLIALVLWGMPTGLAFAAPGDLDTSYGLGTGKSLADFGGSDQARAVALQPDGKIVVAGQSNANGGNDFAVTRLLNPQGTFDTSYGLGTAKSLADFGGSDVAFAMALQSDGKIVVAGESNANQPFYDFAVARLLNPQGTFDTSYGLGTGKSLADLGNGETARAVALQPDGKIVLAGLSNANGGNDFAVARLLNPQGTFDSSFGYGTGRSIIDVGGSDFAKALALQPDGKMVVAGYSNANGTNDLAVVRLLNPEGVFDGTFGITPGRSLIDFGGSDLGTAVALQPDGKIIVVGDSDANGASEFAVSRLQSNGQIDSSFFGNGTGRSLVNLGGADFPTAVALQPDGKIVIAGYSNANGTQDFAVARLQPNGFFDTTFGDNGKSLVNFGGNDYANAVVLQPDGKIVVAGYSNTNGTLDFAVARLQGDPGGGSAGGGGGPGGSGSGGPPRCAGKQATIVGTAGNDTLKGASGSDVIVGLGGNDKLVGNGGNDWVCGGSGKDRVSGGKGRDRLYGNDGNDRLSGGAGNDRLSGGAGKDRLSGGRGRDKLNGGPSRDILNGGPGNDSCSGKDRKRSC